jgi:hypothetical protein
LIDQVDHEEPQMSQENALRFVLHVAQDPVMSRKVIEAIRVGDVDHILILAQEAGLSFTRAELRSTLSTYVSNHAAGAKLATTELDSIIGAGEAYSENDGFGPNQHYQFILNLYQLWPG